MAALPTTWAQSGSWEFQVLLCPPNASTIYFFIYCVCMCVFCFDNLIESLLRTGLGVHLYHHSFIQSVSTHLLNVNHVPARY